jgi:hypothetical protein
MQPRELQDTSKGISTFSGGARACSIRVHTGATAERIHHF